MGEWSDKNGGGDCGSICCGIDKKLSLNGKIGFSMSILVNFLFPKSIDSLVATA